MNPDELNTALTDEPTAPVENAQPEAVASPDVEAAEPVVTPEPKLYAGKYQSPEELEKAYEEVQQLAGSMGQRINDPEFIYQQAQRLGLTEEQAQAAVDEAAKPASKATVQTPPPMDPAIYIQRQVSSSLDYEKALDELPDLKTNKTYRAWAGALVADGKSHLQAAKEIKATLGKATESARTEGLTQARTEITDKERAQTAVNAASGNVDSDEVTQLEARARNRTKPKEQDKAVIELLMRKNRSQT